MPYPKNLDPRLVEALNTFPYQPLFEVCLLRGGNQLKGYHTEVYIDFDIAKVFDETLVGGGYLELEEQENHDEWVINGRLALSLNANWEKQTLADGNIVVEYTSDHRIWEISIE